MSTNDAVLRRRADEEISERSRPGALALVAVTAGLFFFSRAVDESPWIARPLLVSAMVVNAARLVLALQFRRVYERSRRVWLGVFAGLGNFHALVWGLGSAYLIQYSSGLWTAMVIMLITAAMAAGSCSSLAPSLAQMRVYIFLVLAPGVIMGFTTPRPEGLSMGLMHAAYILYLWAHGSRNHRVIWAHWSAERRLEDTNEQLRQANAQALEALQAKTMFLANMSHELRTPLHAALGTAQLLESSPLESKQHEMVSTIRRSGEHLLSLLNDILDLSKAEAGKMVLEAVPVDLRGSIGEVVQLMAPLAERKGLDLRFEYHDALTGRFLLDPLRLRQVMSNLLANAIKFTERGQVTVTVTPAGTGSRPNGRARIEVRDTGIGIAADKLARVFDNFTQADASNTRRFGGTGLGLAISRKLIELMGGAVGVESAPGEGSRFWFDLPLSRAAAEATPTPIAPRTLSRLDGLVASDLPPRREALAHPPRVLLAEDNPTSQRVLIAMLEHLGCEVDLAVDGQEAVARVEAGRYDLVFLDCQMPILDGYEAARRIRALPGARNRVALVALTANTLPGEEERCLDAGMDDYLPKPLRLTDLEAALTRWVGPLRGRDDASADPAGEPALLREESA